MVTSSMPLIPPPEAVQRVYGLASATLQSQARLALSGLREASGDIPALVEGWMCDDELSPATVRKRLNCLSKMGVNVTGHRPKLDRVPKWWLRPADYKAIQDSVFLSPLFKLYVAWAVRTGLRVEESLRLTPSMLQGGCIAVPGTKTELSASVLPMARETEDIVQQAMSLTKGNPFPWSYDTLRELWQEARCIIGADDQPTATLKALRRNAARYLHVDRGMPLDMVRQYLRHTDIETTLGYLRLTGGYGENEMRRYL